jgi:signal peptidase I
MYHHNDGFEDMFKSDVYEDYGVSINDTKDWVFQNGFSKGDVIFVIGPKNIKVGDVIIFNAGAQYPLIHRVIKADDTYSTKGDNYKTNARQLNSEKVIDENQIIGKALFKIPFVGWIKLIFFEGNRPSNERGFCN